LKRREEKEEKNKKKRSKNYFKKRKKNWGAPVHNCNHKNIAGRISEAAMGGAGAGDLIFHNLCSLHVVQWNEKSP
jgi:hypothetical protein